MAYYFCVIMWMNSVNNFQKRSASGCFLAFALIFLGVGEGGGGLKKFLEEGVSYKLYITTPIWLTIYMQNGRYCITCYFSVTFLDFFLLLKYFLIVSYFINNLFKKNSI